MSSPFFSNKISVIIPTYNEEDCIAGLVHYLQNDSSCNYIAEIIIADGGSKDNTKLEAEQAGATVISSKLKSRSLQMNLGASHAQSEVLYFLHADTFPPKGFAKIILSSIHSGVTSGCFRLKFDLSHWFLNFNSWFTRFNINAFRFGDQSLYVTASAFRLISGFDPKRILLEDQEIITRLQKVGQFKVLDQSVVTSARQYKRSGIFRLQMVYYILYGLYLLGASQSFLWRKYRQWIY
ncbi:MAG: TIGR04283 family arsenosugar biosynthesis glycosyltransferase [Cyclobacteriaceae bacterium]